MERRLTFTPSGQSNTFVITNRFKSTSIAVAMPAVLIPNEMTANGTKWTVERVGDGYYRLRSASYVGVSICAWTKTRSPSRPGPAGRGRRALAVSAPQQPFTQCVKNVFGSLIIARVNMI